MRVRLVYSKRGGACFVPHIALAQIVARSALRAGFMPEMTQGFSPRARLSFAPELPAGVVALNEVVDMYFSDNTAGTISPPKNADSVNVSLSGNHSGTGYHDKIAEAVDDFSPYVFVDAMNAALPEGFRISRVLFPAEDSPSLGKSCKHAEYLIRNTHGVDFLDMAKNFYGSALLKAEHLDNWSRLIIHQPAQFPIGGFIKHMIAQNIITGWHQVNIVRVSIGIYHQQKDCVSINA
ncbi:MAG: DUF2344 domain-containing protein [Synergistaceae bacterium]|nr:DUF2344 domain-containing protein [Synergistaceae bacterium]